MRPIENPFSNSTLAAGYANARPPVHPRIIERVRPLLAPCHRALDVGCGAGLSTRALLALADRVIGIEPVEEMVHPGQAIVPEASLLVGAAEQLPFRGRAFDLISAAGSLNYVRLPLFFPEARRVLTLGGHLLVYDFKPGRSCVGSTALDAWNEEFLHRYPPGPSRATPLDPEILTRTAEGFQLRHSAAFDVEVPLTVAAYAEYRLTGTHIGAAVARGESLVAIRDWCLTSLSAVFQDRARGVLFPSWFAFMQALS